MNSSFLKSFLFFFFSILFLCIFFIPVCFTNSDDLLSSNTSFITSSNEFIWPIPNYMTITSPFGKRISPTISASSFHKGIDIGAPEGTKLYAVCDGEITFADFLGGGGYTITLSAGDFKFTYCHVSPHFRVLVGNEILKGEYIANVGPKNVYGITNNPYKDKNGNPTNGATTGCHLHFGVRYQGKYIDPMCLFDHD